MKDYLLKHIICIYEDVPELLYLVLLLLFVLGSVLIIVNKSFQNEKKAICLLLLVEYIVLIYCSTVLFRTYDEGQGYSLQPFWSYKSFFEGKSETMAINILNVAAFVPIGLLLGFSFKRMKWFYVLLVVFLLSVSIELLQFVMKRGFAEIDDVVHNIIGCMIGYGLYVIFNAINDKFSKKRVTVL